MFDLSDLQAKNRLFDMLEKKRRFTLSKRPFNKIKRRFVMCERHFVIICFANGLLNIQLDFIEQQTFCSACLSEW